MKKEFFNKLLLKYIGKIEYIITITNSIGEIKKYQYVSIKDVDAFVNEINAEIYWMIEKIEKIRRYDFKYKKEIIHTPLCFSCDKTETFSLDNKAYQF